MSKLSRKADPANFLDTLRSIVGTEHVLDQDQVRDRATHFWDPTPMQAKYLVKPASTQETASVLKLCHTLGQSVVTHGGLTGLVDGNHCTSDDVVVSFERQNQIESVDEVDRTITVQAGAILETVQSAANDAGLQLGLDLGARGSCTLGGNLSTNAGGLSVLRYGMAREQVLGLEVVLADGTIMSSMNRMMKNNTGYDLKQLFIGSEGTLGIITRAVLRLRSQTPVINTALLAFNNFEQVTQTLQHLDKALAGTLNAFEVMWQPFYALNTDPDISGTVSAPLERDYPLYAIVESRGTDEGTANDRFQQALEVAFTKNILTDATLAQSEKERSSIWFTREHIDLALDHDPVFVYDISLPISEMKEYVVNMSHKVSEQWAGALLYVYGHLADGNLHVLIAPQSTEPATNEQQTQWLAHSNDIVFGPLQAIGGSVSAEHGIGLSKKNYLSLSRNPTEIALMKTLKITLDPKGILNPGKIFSV